MLERIFSVLFVAIKVRGKKPLLCAARGARSSDARHNLAFSPSIRRFYLGLCFQDPSPSVAAESASCLVNVCESSNEEAITKQIDAVLSILGEIIQRPPSLEVQKYAITAFGAL